MSSITSAATLEDVPEGCGVMAVLDRSGDYKIVWDRNNADEVAAARRTFDDLRKKHHIAYSVKRDGEKGEVIREFDPAAEKIILAPPLVGG